MQKGRPKKTERIRLTPAIRKKLESEFDREMMLGFENIIRRNNPNLSPDELRKRALEKVIETRRMYSG
jgi:hypothetical protein